MLFPMIYLFLNFKVSSHFLSILKIQNWIFIRNQSFSPMKMHKFLENDFFRKKVISFHFHNFFHPNFKNIYTTIWVMFPRKITYFKNDFSILWICASLSKFPCKNVRVTCFGSFLEIFFSSKYIWILFYNIFFD